MNLSQLTKSQGPEPKRTYVPQPSLWDSRYSESYGDGVLLHKSLVTAIHTGKIASLPPYQSFTALSDRFLKLLKEDADGLLSLAARSTPDVYLYAHSVNVAIFALRTGMALGWPDSELVTLGAAALLEDLGLAKKLDIVQKPSRLTQEELGEVRKHPEEGKTLLGLFRDIPEAHRPTLEAVLSQTHERRNGRGYPAKLEGNKIHPAAQITSVCDVYEALTHPRSYRDRLLAHMGVQVLLESSGDDFEEKVVEALVESISLYPPASFVRLNTGEFGQVLSLNPGLPTRPKIRIILDETGKRLKPSHLKDLSTDALFYITEAADETIVAAQDKRFALQIRAQRWWIEGL